MTGRLTLRSQKEERVREPVFSSPLRKLSADEIGLVGGGYEVEDSFDRKNHSGNDNHVRCFDGH